METASEYPRVSFACTRLVVILIALFTVATAYLSHAVIMQSFRDLERQEALKNISRVYGCVQRELEGLSAVATDYTNWDDMYDFVNTKSQEFAAKNLDMAYFAKNFGLSAVEVRDAQGKPVWQGTGEEENPSKALNPGEIVGERTILILKARAIASQKPVSGLLQREDETYFLSVSGIVPSSRKAEPNGAMYFVKKLSPAFLAAMAKNIQVDFSILPVGQASRDAITEILEIDEKTLLVAQGAKDILDTPAFKLEAKLNRDIYSHGKRVAAMISTAILVIGGLAAYLSLFGIKSALVLNTRMAQLDLAVKEKDKEIRIREEAEAKLDQALEELRESLANIKTLEGILPICASCKKIRDDKGYWTQVEAYVTVHSRAKFSHSICPDCVNEFYSDYKPRKDAGKSGSSG